MFLACLVEALVSDYYRDLEKVLERYWGWLAITARASNMPNRLLISVVIQHYHVATIVLTL